MGDVRVLGGDQRAPAVTDDAKGEGSGEVYGELRVRVRRGAIFVVRALDFASV